MKEQDLKDLKGNSEEINAVLRDLYTLPKYRIINALLGLSQCYVNCTTPLAMGADENLIESMRCAKEVLKTTSDDPEYYPTCLLDTKKKSKVVYMFGSPGTA